VNRNQALEAAKKRAQSALATASNAGHRVTKLTRSLKKLRSAQAKARAAYLKRHRSPAARAAFIATQAKAAARSKAALKAAVKAAAIARAAAGAARAAQRSAQASFDQCA